MNTTTDTGPETAGTRYPLIRGVTIGLDEQTEIRFEESVREGDPETIQFRVGGFGYGSVLIWTNEAALRRLANRILEHLEPENVTPFGIPGDVTTVEVADVVVGDTISVPDWPDQRWEIVTRIAELAPGIADIHVETGERFTWPADHAVQVRLPRQQRERAVPCVGLHPMAKRPLVTAVDALCEPCRAATPGAQDLAAALQGGAA